MATPTYPQHPACDGGRSTHGNLLVTTYRYAFGAGWYAEARDAATGERRAFTGVYRGRGGKDKAIASALHQARTGCAAPDDVGCIG